MNIKPCSNHVNGGMTDAGMGFNTTQDDGINLNMLKLVSLLSSLRYVLILLRDGVFPRIAAPQEDTWKILSFQTYSQRRMICPVREQSYPSLQGSINTNKIGDGSSHRSVSFQILTSY